MNQTHRRFPWIKVAALLLVIGLGVVVASYVATRKDRRGRATQTQLADGPARTEFGPHKPQVWAVVIGIDEYPDEGIPSCHGAARDARAIGRWLKESAGWNGKNVLVMDDLGAPEPGPVDDLLPTRANLDWAVKEWLGRRVKPDDVVVISFAGQAVGLPAVERTPDRQLLLPIDARADDLGRTGWALEDVLDGLASSGRNPVVCWLDTSLAGRGRPVGKLQADPSASTRWLDRLARWPGVTAWLAADGHPAIEASAVGEHSAFTTALLKALGTPDRPNNLLAALDHLNRDPAMFGQGFRTLGGIAPDLNLWSRAVQVAAKPRRELLLQRGHALGISAIAFTADGSRMVTAGRDSTVKVWRVADRKVLRALPYHMVGVTALAMSPDGRWIISGDGSGRVRVWDLVANREAPAGSNMDRGIERLDFLSGGERFVALDMDGKVWLGDVTDPGGRAKSLGEKSIGLACASASGPLAFAIGQVDGKVATFAADGTLKKVFDGPGGLVTSPRLASDGRRLAAADEAGRVLVRDVVTGKVVYEHDFQGPIDVLSLAVGRPGTIQLVDLDQPQRGSGVALAILGAPGELPPLNQTLFSIDGRWLAAAMAEGGLIVWGLADRAHPKSIPLADNNENVTATTIAFAPDGRSIVVGEQDGGIRAWELPDGDQRPRVAPRRGQVAGLSVSGDGRFLLQVSRDGKAQVWDLQDSRGLTLLAGEWTSGAIAPDGSRIALTDPKSGDVVLFDRVTGQRRPTVFARPKAKSGNGPVAWPFAMVTFSTDGKRVAAGSPEGPLACIWETETGRLVHEVRGHDDPHPITAVGFSADSTRLITASEDGSARAWDLAAGALNPPELASFRPVDERTNEPVPVTAARFDPTDSRRVATGGVDGRVMLWEVGKREPVATVGSLEGSVTALTFTPDAKWLAAAGDGKRVRLWGMDPHHIPVQLDPSQQHTERVNALIAWPNASLLASGSDDTTIRLWDLAGSPKGLLGTLTAEQGTADWVAYTPDGLFDSSANGDRQVTWLDRDDVVPLEQSYDTYHVFMLTDQLRRGHHPPPPAAPKADPPRVMIDPPTRPIAAGRDAELLITLADPDLTDLRLYQNGVPVRSGREDFGLQPGQRQARLPVHLRGGANRFYAMASRPGSIDGRSREVEIDVDGPDHSGRVHVLALGVSDYQGKGRGLKFAADDARDFADFLHDHGLDDLGEPGRRFLFTNDKVKQTDVEEAFHAIRDEVRDRPEDTVVVFVAGHTDVLARRFYLLLPGFLFPKPGALGRAPHMPSDVDDNAVLSYVALYRNMARLGALQRLIVMDACQAEAIFDDPGVRQIQELIDDGSHRAKTSYILAARRGEPANEDSAIEHGLLTYVLLRGLGRRDLNDVPGLTIFRDLPTADRDHNGWVSTEELRWYADQTLPLLVANFPAAVPRSGPGRQTAESFRPLANLNQGLRLQVADTPFPLLRVPDAAPPGSNPNPPGPIAGD